MVGNAGTINRDLFVRRCVGCGCDGALLGGGHADHCPCCGVDLRLRPARSYAEMEGFVAPPAVTHEAFSDSGLARRRAQTDSRWLSFLVLATTGLVVLAYLFAAALP